jgi:hypothetical protein
MVRYKLFSINFSIISIYCGFYNQLMFDFLPEFKHVTCGSAVKLLNPYHHVRLHSHEVKYGSGSGQQVSLSSLRAPTLTSTPEWQPPNKPD